MDSSYLFPTEWKESLDGNVHPLSIASVQSATEDSSPGSETPSFVDVSGSSNFSPPSTSGWPDLTPSSTGDTSPMTAETVLSITHYKFPPSTSSGSLVEVESDLNASVTTVQSTPVSIATRLPPRPSSTATFVESDSKQPPTPTPQPLEHSQMPLQPRMFSAGHRQIHVHSARATPANDLLQASPLSPHEIRVVSPSEASSTPNRSHTLSASELRMVCGNGSMQEQVDQYLRPTSLATFSSRPSSPNLLNLTRSITPRSLSPLTEAARPVTQAPSQDLAEIMIDPNSFPDRRLSSSSYEELSRSLADLGLASMKEDGGNWRWCPVNAEEEEEVDVFKDVPQKHAIPSITYPRPPLSAMTSASSSEFTDSWTKLPGRTSDHDGAAEGHRNAVKLPSLTTHLQSFLPPNQPAIRPSPTDASRVPQSRSNKPEKNGHLRAEPGWKRVPPPSSQVPQLSPLPLSPMHNPSANKSRDFWMPNPSYVPSPPVKASNIKTLVMMGQDHSKEDHSDKTPQKPENRDGAQLNKILSRQPSINSLKPEYVYNPVPPSMNSLKPEYVYNPVSLGKGKEKERVSSVPNYLSAEKLYHNGPRDENDHYSQILTQQPTPYHLFDILHRQNKERTNSTANVQASFSEKFSPTPTPASQLPNNTGDDKKVPSSYLHFVDPLPDADSPVFPTDSKNNRGSFHSSVRFARPPVQHVPSPAVSAPTGGFVQPFNAARLSHLTPMSDINNWSQRGTTPGATSWGPSGENPLVTSPPYMPPPWNQSQPELPMPVPTLPTSYRNSYSGGFLGPQGYIPQPTPLNKHPEFWMEGINDPLVWIRVGIVDYLLPARIFLRNSQHLRTTLRSHTQSGNPGPVILNEVHNWEFECLLRVFFSSDDPTGQLTTVMQWEKVLEVMELWEFHPRLKEHAYSKLSPLLTAADRVHIGRTYNKPSWIRRGLIELCKRNTPLTVEECRRLGPEDTSRITELQFARHFMIPQVWNDAELARQVHDKFDLDDFFATGCDCFLDHNRH